MLGILLVRNAFVDDTVLYPMQRTVPKFASPAAFATTASALIALVTVAAVMGSLPGTVVSVRVALLDSRGCSTESETVRAVAAAVAAVARNLVGGEQLSAAMPAPSWVEVDALFPAVTTTTTSFFVCRSRILDERLIDMPPPTC